MEILIKDKIKEAVEMLKKSGVSDYENDSWLLAEYVFGITRQTYYMNPEPVHKSST